MLYPIKVVDIELSQPIQTIEGLDGYMKLQGLVRLHGTPIGYIQAPITNNCCEAATISKLVLEQHSWKIIQQLLQNGLASSNRSGDLRLEDLFDVPPPQCSEPLPLVTVAVCTRDRPNDMKLCLEAIAQLDYPNLDILVVDNAPQTEATKELIENHYPQVRYVREPRPGLDWARNRAILEAQGEIIAYTDDDVVVDPGWVKALATVFAENPEVMAVTGLIVPYELETDAQVLFEMCGGFGKGFETKRFQVKTGDKMPWWYLGGGNYGAGANMAYRRSVFNNIGYFDPALDVGTVTNGGGDQEMYFRVLKEGYTLIYEPKAMVRHRHRRDYAKLRSQLAGNGGAYSYMTCGVLNYPDETLSFLRLGITWLLSWHMRRLLISFIHPTRYPRDLILAEIQGCLLGLTRYYKARKNMRSIEKTFGPQVSTTLPHKSASSISIATTPKSGIAIRTVELSHSIQPIVDVTEYNRIRVFVTKGGALLGSLNIDNQQQIINATRLREELTRNLDLKLIQSDYSNMNSCWSEAVEILKRHYTPTGNESIQLKPNKLPSDISVTIVLSTYDRPESLRRCLYSLTAQKVARKIEIIVVDNYPGSQLTPPIVSEFPEVILIKESRRGSSYARNAGIAASTGDIIVTIDDDVVVSAHWLEHLIAPFARPDIAIVTGNILPLELESASQQIFENYGGLGRGFEPFEVDGTWYELFPHKPSPTWWLGATANAAFRTSIFHNSRIGMMEEKLGAGMFSGVGEDTYLFYKALKAGYTLVYEPRAYVWHQHRSDMAALRQQIYNYSKGHVAYNLITWLQDQDWRGLAQILIGLPLAHLTRVKQYSLGQGYYPIHLVLLEILGNLAGPWSLWQSHRRVKREGRSTASERLTQDLKMDIRQT